MRGTAVKTSEDNSLKHGFSIQPENYYECDILFLGSFPGKVSREANFYYAHPRNRFWRILSDVFGGAVGETVAEKIAFLKFHRIAVWDIIATARTDGSLDSDLKNLSCVPLTDVITGTNIRHIFCNGQKAYREVLKHYPALSQMTTPLPSTSPANAAVSYEELLKVWTSKILK